MSGIRDMEPEAYAEMLRGQGVPEDQIRGRVAHDLLAAVREQFAKEGVPPGYGELDLQLRIVFDDSFTPNEIILGQQILTFAKELRRTNQRLDFWVFLLKGAIVGGVLSIVAKYFW